MVGLLLVDPWLARSFGFALSVAGDRRAGAAGAGLGAGWRPAGCRGRLAEALAVPLAAQLVCAPVVVLLSGQVSLVAVPANLLAAPAVAPATVLGVLATGSRAAERRPRPPLLAAAAGVPVGWLVLVAHPVRRGARGRGRLAGVGAPARRCWRRRSSARGRSPPGC